MVKQIIPKAEIFFVCLLGFFSHRVMCFSSFARCIQAESFLLYDLHFLFAYSTAQFCRYVNPKERFEDLLRSPLQRQNPELAVAVFAGSLAAALTGHLLLDARLLKKFTNFIMNKYPKTFSPSSSPHPFCHRFGVFLSGLLFSEISLSSSLSLSWPPHKNMSQFCQQLFSLHFPKCPVKYA